MICELSICFGSFAISCTIGFCSRSQSGRGCKQFSCISLNICLHLFWNSDYQSRGNWCSFFADLLRLWCQKKKLPVRNLILMPFAHIAIAVGGESGSSGARGNGGQVSSFNWEKISKSTGTERVKYHRPGKETGNKIQSTVAEKMETFGLNVITSQA